MRDAQRIPSILKHVEGLWRLHPDWRLGQLVCNLAAGVDPSRNAVWDIEDEQLVAEIERFVSQRQPPQSTGSAFTSPQINQPDTESPA